jgi:hypothetical protein
MPHVLSQALWLTLGGISSVLGAIFIWAGAYEIRRGQNAPGRLGRGIFPRSGKPTTESWSAAKWRQNGRLIVTTGLSMVMLGLTLAVVAFR